MHIIAYSRHECSSVLLHFPSSLTIIILTPGPTLRPASQPVSHPPPCCALQEPLFDELYWHPSKCQRSISLNNMWCINAGHLSIWCSCIHWSRNRQGAQQAWATWPSTDCAALYNARWHVLGFYNRTRHGIHSMLWMKRKYTFWPALLFCTSLWGGKGRSHRSQTNMVCLHAVMHSRTKQWRVYVVIGILVSYIRHSFKWSKRTKTLPREINCGIGLDMPLFSLSWCLNCTMCALVAHSNRKGLLLLIGVYNEIIKPCIKMTQGLSNVQLKFLKFVLA